MSNTLLSISWLDGFPAADVAQAWALRIGALIEFHA